MIRLVFARAGWLAGVAVSVYILLLIAQASKFSLEYLALHARYYATCSIAGIAAGTAALWAFLYLARMRAVRLGPPGEQERFAVGCFVVYFLFMVWAAISYATMRP